MSLILHTDECGSPEYPMLQESEQEDMDTFGIEMNSWVDTVLKVVYDNGKGRDIIFSSFHPDICLMLSFKQVCESNFLSYVY